MAQNPYTQQRSYQQRGPSSDEYNTRIEENAKDLSFLYNTAAQIQNNFDKAKAAFYKELLFFDKSLISIKARLESLELGGTSLGFTNYEQVDNDRFDSTAYAIAEADRCSLHTYSHTLTLPRVDSSSISKVRFQNEDGTYNIPPSLQMAVTQVSGTADSGNAVIETSQPFNAIIAEPGRIWERNVITTAPDSDGAQLYLSVLIPNDLSATAETNCIQINPFPLSSVDVLEVSYTTDLNVNLATHSNWTPFNEEGLYDSIPEAIGYIVPGGWVGDEILASTTKVFYFAPKKITAIRFKIRQKNYLMEGPRYIYSYGMSKLDVRYEKFLSRGRAIIKFTAPETGTISSVDSIIPQIWNVSEAELNDVFSYRVIWESAYDSGVYTLTPVPLSKRVWIEVTLQESADKIPPALSGLILDYS